MNSFVARYRDNSEPLVSLETRMRFNPNLDPAWFGGVMAIINNITMLAIVLTGSALIREREHGTVEHLLVMPITPFEIMMAKVWSMGLVVLVVSGLSLVLMVKGVLGVPIEGSIRCLCWAWRSVCLPLRRSAFYGDDSAFNAATGAAGDSGAATAANAFRWIHAARKYAADGAGHYADHADDTLCQPRAGHSLPWCRIRNRLAAVPDADGNWRRIFHYRAAAIQEDDWDNGVNTVARCVSL